MSIARYSVPSILLHWLTVAAIFSAFLLVWSLEWFDFEAQEKAIVFIHKSLGLTVILLTLARVILKVSGNAGTQAERETPLHRIAVALGHLGLYGLMLAAPVLGWLKTSAAGKAVSLFGLPLPALVSKNRDLAEWYGDLHETAAYVFLGLIALHILVALWHGFIRKDSVLYSMLPLRHLSTFKPNQ